MMNIRNIYRIVLSLVLIALLGCTPATKKTVVPQEEKIEKNENSFNPLELAADKTIVPKEYPTESDISGKNVLITSDQKVTDSLVQEYESIPGEIDTLNSQSFRIQLFSSKVYGEARKAMVVAKEIFDRPLFMDYEVPYYKIRVGDFPNRDQAEDYLMRVRSTGYSNAWVVIVNVNQKELSPMYEGEDIDLLIEDSLEVVDSLKNNDIDSE